MTIYEHISSFARSFGRPFSAKTVVDYLEITPNTVQTYLNKLLSEGKICKVAGSPKGETFYAKKSSNVSNLRSSSLLCCNGLKSCIKKKILC